MLGAVGLLGVDPQRDRRPLAAGLAASYAGIVVLTALFALAGAAMTASNSSANALLLAAAPENIRGQTVSLFMLAVRGGSSIGSLLTGLSVSALGVREALLINGALALVAQWVIGRAWCRARARAC